MFFGKLGEGSITTIGAFLPAGRIQFCPLGTSIYYILHKLFVATEKVFSIIKPFFGRRETYVSVYAEKKGTMWKVETPSLSPP